MVLNQLQVQEDAKRALAEDIGSGDISADLLPKHRWAEAQIVSREPMMMCGQPWVEAVFHEVAADINLQWQVEEGTWLEKPALLCQLYGPVRALLTAERSALNFLQLLSGTATQTYRYQCQIKGYETRLLDTRKTIPGLRLAQKYAVACAGGENHRVGLYDAFLIKENHIKACGSIRDAILCARQDAEHRMVEVEVETLSEFEEALSALPDRILLDNFSHEMLRTAVAMNHPKRVLLEASGGIDLDNIEAVAQTGVDYISVGAITKSVKAIDLSLLIHTVSDC